VAKNVFGGVTALDVHPGFERRAVRFVGAPGTVVPFPFNRRTIELLEVIPALELGGEKDGSGRSRHPRRRPEVERRLFGLVAAGRGDGKTPKSQPKRKTAYDPLQATHPDLLVSPLYGGH